MKQIRLKDGIQKIDECRGKKFNESDDCGWTCPCGYDLDSDGLLICNFGCAAKVGAIPIDCPLETSGTILDVIVQAAHRLMEAVKKGNNHD